jgi:LCP family protein required for cell wall assembly
MVIETQKVEIMSTYRRPTYMIKPRRSTSMVKPRRDAPTQTINLPEPFASDPRLIYLAILFAFLMLVTVVVGWMIFSNLKAAPQKIAPDVPASNPNNSNSIVPGGSEYTHSLTHSNDPVGRAWDGSGRVTVLVVGLDARDGEGTAARTDSMILFSMDPATHTAGMLSIPRDMWVKIPGYGEDKINTAYYKGEMDQTPGAGPGLAVRTVEQFIGMPINYFAQIDFNSFVKLIDETGGVDIKVRENMVIDPIGPNNTINLKPGTQTLNGAQALAYARVRDMGHGDFDRAARQQQVIMAVRDNILNYYSLPKLILKAPSLYNDVATGVRTNMTLADAIRMAYYVQQINVDNVRHGVINEPDQVTASFDTLGEYILVPDMAAVNALRDQVFGVNPQVPTPPAPLDQSIPLAAAPQAQAAPAQEEQPTEIPQPTVKPVPTLTPTTPLSPQDAAKAEKAQIIVLNATSTAGLAAQTHEYLMLRGMRVIKDGNADNPVDVTELRVAANKPATVAYLADLLHVPASRIFNQNADASTPADIIIILGADWAAKNDMP